MWQGVKIADTSEGCLSFDLKDILPLAGERAAASQWQCRFVECSGERAEELHAISDEGRRISGDELLRIAAGILQVIDGEFVAYKVEPWLEIRAIDSSYFHVLSTDPDVIAEVRRKFREVSDLPPDAI